MKTTFPPAEVTGIPPTRPYQQEMLESSLRGNIVIAMDTGSGKTHIAVLRMKIEAEREPCKISWFIAPTVGLCEQQRDVIRAYLPVPVGLISGALEPDQWKDPRLWKDALATHRIIVSTPQVLLDALRHGYVNLGCDVGLLVFDEAHHTADKHPYNMIMREFYDKCPPRTGSNSCASQGSVRPFVLGLTASPIFGGNVKNAFAKIEKNLDSIILAPLQTRDELAKHVHRPVFKHIVYPPLADALDAHVLSPNVLSLAVVVEALDIQNDPTVRSLRQRLAKPGAPADKKRIDQLLSRAIEKGDTFVYKGMHDFLRTAKELCVDVGPWAADWYVVSVVSKALNGGMDALQSLFAERRPVEKAYLLDVLRKIKIVDVSYAPDVVSRGSSAKANKLMACLLDEKAEWEARGEVYSGLVFVTRRDAVLALSELLAHHPAIKGSFSVGTLIGGSDSNKKNAFLDITRTMLPKSHGEVLADFRAGEKDLVISTAVAEEGIDIQACGSVIRWDLPMNMVSWVQSRGRARHVRSSFILMFEDGGCHSQQMQKWEHLEKDMIKKYIDEQRSLEAALANSIEDDDDNDDDLEFTAPLTGAKVTLHSSISHIAHFCNTLISTQGADAQPTYDIEPPDYPTGYHTLPQGSIQLMRNPGPYGATLTLPRLIPPDQRVYTTEIIHKSKQSARRHVAFKAYVALYKAGLLNEHLLPLGGSILPLQEEEVRKILKDIEKREGRETLRAQMNPWTSLNKEANAGSAGPWWLNELRVEGVGEFRMLTRRELKNIDLSSEVLHDPEYGPRRFSIRALGDLSLSADDILSAKHFTRRLFSVFHGSKIKWDDLDYAYLFLPSLVRSGDDWEQRRTWADTVRPEVPDMGARERSVIDAAIFGHHYQFPSDLFMVISDHSRFKFQGWRDEKLSSEEEAAIRKRYSRFDDLAITYPLIVAQPLRYQSNFLLPPKERSTQMEKVILLPSLTTVVLDNEINIRLGLFLPSILRALFIKLIAVDLQNALLDRAPSLQRIPIDLVETALMAPAANAHFDYQRLETLGDTVLKLITSVQLLAEHPHWPEGFVSKRKDRAICNAYLAQTAIGKNLYRWIIRRVFPVRKWRPDYLHEEEPCSAVQFEDKALIDTEGDLEDAFADEEAGEATDRTEPDDLNKLSTKTLADVIEALIGAAYLSGGFDSAIACADAFEIDIGSVWKPLSTRVSAILAGVEPLGDPPKQLSYTETILGYAFKHKLLLVEALTHASSQSELPSVSYERMEFLGDALLDAVIVDVLYRTEERHYTPGEIHERKAALVNMHFLAFVCLRADVAVDAVMPRWDAASRQPVRSSEQQTVHLGQCLMHSDRAILDETRDAFTRFRKGHAEIKAALEEGRVFPWAALARLQAPKFLADIVESLLGAVYLDSGGDMKEVEAVLERLGVMKVLRRLVREDVDVRHPVSRVSEWAAKHQLLDGLQYRMDVERGRILCTLVVGGDEVASASERYNGKASEDNVRFEAAEAGIQVLLEKYDVSGEAR